MQFTKTDADVTIDLGMHLRKVVKWNVLVSGYDNWVAVRIGAGAFPDDRHGIIWYLCDVESAAACLEALQKAARDLEPWVRNQQPMCGFPDLRAVLEVEQAEMASAQAATDGWPTPCHGYLPGLDVVVDGQWGTPPVEEVGNPAWIHDLGDKREDS